MPEIGRVLRKVVIETLSAYSDWNYISWSDNFAGYYMSAADEIVWMQIGLPDNVHSITKAEIRLLSGFFDETDLDIDIIVDMAGCGEDHDVRTASDLASVYSFVADEIKCVDILPLLALAKSGDTIQVRLTMNSVPNWLIIVGHIIIEALILPEG